MNKPLRVSEKAIHQLMATKTKLLSQAQALHDLGLQEAAMSLWAEIARREEEIAPLLEAQGREVEAAAHRISAASSYEQVGEFGRAVNLYHAALAGPLQEPTRTEVKGLLDRCLARLAPSQEKVRSTPARRSSRGTVVS